jgi:Flp pilus assembly protein TadG
MVVPVFFVIFLALFEFARVDVIRHSIQTAAYEGARDAIVPNANAERARTVALENLNAIMAIHGDVTVNPAVITPQTPEVTVTVDVPLDDNAWVVPMFFQGKRLTTSVTLSRERSELIVF